MHLEGCFQTLTNGGFDAHIRHTLRALETAYPDADRINAVQR